MEFRPPSRWVLASSERLKTRVVMPSAVLVTSSIGQIGSVVDKISRVEEKDEEVGLCRRRVTFRKSHLRPCFCCSRSTEALRLGRWRTAMETSADLLVRVLQQRRGQSCNLYGWINTDRSETPAICESSFLRFVASSRQKAGAPLAHTHGMPRLWDASPHASGNISMQVPPKFSHHKGRLEIKWPPETPIQPDAVSRIFPPLSRLA